MTESLENRNDVFLPGRKSEFENTVTASSTTYNANCPEMYYFEGRMEHGVFQIDFAWTERAGYEETAGSNWL